MSISKRRVFNKREHEIVLNKTKGVCAHCGKKLNTDNMTIDHVYPMDKGGLNDEYNLLPLCKDCNIVKSNFVYNLLDFYKHIDEKEQDTFSEYYNFAAFEYLRKTIIGYDELLFYYLPYHHKRLLYNMQKRKAASKKISQMADNLYVPVSLTRAWPAAYERIFAFIEKNQTKCKMPHNLYQTAYDVLGDIQTGCVYVLERQGELCGVFIFRNVSEISENMRLPQLMNVADVFGLEIKYVMTLAMITESVVDVFDQVMRYFERSQMSNRWMPVWFGLLNLMHFEKEECIIVPFEMDGVNSTLDFMPIKYIEKSYREDAEFALKKQGYKDYTEDDITMFTYGILHYVYQSDYVEDKEFLDFLSKYDKMKSYFKPETYKYHNVGFVTK